MTTSWMHPLARAARVLGKRLVDLEKRLPEDPLDPAWEPYLQTAELLAAVVEAQKAAVPAVVVKGAVSSGPQPSRASRAASHTAQV